MPRWTSAGPDSPPVLRSRARRRACELGQVEGLGQIVVGAGIEGRDLAVAGVAGGEDQHRQPAASRAQFPQHRQAVAPRQAEIENADVVRLVEKRPPRRFGVAHPIDREVGLLQPGADPVAKQRIIFHQKGAQ